MTAELAVSTPGRRDPLRIARRRRGCRRTLLVALSLATVVGSLAVVLPRTVGAQWSGISTVALRVSPPDIAVLFVVWLSGLAVYGVVQAAALPGLGVQRALMLNFAGSCVSNVVPLGGVAGTGLNLAMIKRWNHSTQSFVRFLAVTHMLNLVAKLVLPAVAIAALLATGAAPTGPLLLAGAAALLALLAVIAVCGAVLISNRGAAALAAALQPGLRLAGRIWPALGAHDLSSSLADFRGNSVQLVRSSWARFATGMAAYSLLQFLLFLMCLRMVGSAVPVAVLFAAFAAERVMTLVVITPGGVGIAETATAFVLVALHADPVVSTAGVVIYRMFTYLFEIPVGAAWLAVWSALRLRASNTERRAGVTPFAD